MSPNPPNTTPGNTPPAAAVRPNARVILDWVNDDLFHVVLAEGGTERVLIEVGFDEYGTDGMLGVIRAVRAIAEVGGLLVETWGEVGR